MTRQYRVGRVLSDLRADRRGVVAVIGAVGLLILTGATFLATDLTRLHIARARVQSAADAAMLATARELDGTSDSAKTLARQVFDANMPDDYLGLTVNGFDLVFESQGNALDYADTVRLEVAVELPLFVADLGAILRPDVEPLAAFSIRSAAVKRTMGAELVMVLDNTGSMNGTKIQQLRAAAQVLADTVFQGRETIPNLLVGMVNYSATVNVGTQHEEWLDPIRRATLGDDFDAASTSWKGCVMARGGSLDESDAPPADGDLDPFLWPSYNVADYPSPPTIDTEECVENVTKGHCNVWPGTGSYAPVNEDQSARNDGWGPNLSCPDAMVPLTPSYSVIDAAIDRIDAWHRGGTFSNLGLAWGWRLLSPRWSGLWRRPDGTVIAGLPYPYDQPFNHKIIVLMTDGENQHYRHDFTAYGIDGENIPADGINLSMSRLCTAIKDAGIIVFTVTFGSTGSAIETTFRNCASNPLSEKRLGGPFYFDAPDGAQLEAAFRNIGGQIQDLRLIE